MEVLKEGGTFTKEQNSELKSKYNEKYNISWVGMYGFENTYGIAVNKEIADKYNLKTYSDLAKVSNDLTLVLNQIFSKEVMDMMQFLKNTILILKILRIWMLD